MSNVRFATERFWFRPRLSLKLGLTIAFVGVIAYLANQEWRRVSETRWLAQAAKLPNFSPERAAALEKAFACEPENFETAYEIGECYRHQSLNGEEGFAALAQKAIDWYARDTQLNPHDGYGFLCTGMCLDWLGQHGEKTETAYSEAEVRDPNGYFTVANIGWHYVQTDDYAAAQEWFTRSLKLSSEHNEIARNYLSICLTKLADKASGRPQLPSVY
jgi:tetratricopeptide (TPR) repeat protein